MDRDRLLVVLVILVVLAAVILGNLHRTGRF